MKKTFKLTHPKIKPARLIEAVRRDVKKYKKERKENHYLVELIIGILIVNLVIQKLKLRLF